MKTDKKFKTTRAITFSATDNNGMVVAVKVFPSGTMVFQTKARADGSVDIRVAGTLFTQNVFPTYLTAK